MRKFSDKLKDVFFWIAHLIPLLIAMFSIIVWLVVDFAAAIKTIFVLLCFAIIYIVLQITK